MQQIFVIWKIFFAIGICSGLRSKTAVIIRDVNSAKSLSCGPAYVIMRLYRGSLAARLFDKQIRFAVTIKSQAFRNGRSHQRTKSRAMRNYGRLAERSKAAVLKTVDVQASGGSNPSPSAKKDGVLLRSAFLLCEGEKPRGFARGRTAPEVIEPPAWLFLFLRRRR